MTTPGSPSRCLPRKATVERDRILNDLSICWSLTIQPPKDGESPSKRQEKLAVACKADAYAEECFFKINFLCLKDETALSTALHQFQNAASAKQSGWIYKPNADEDLLPRSLGSKPSVTTAQREQLFQCLLRFIDPAYEQVKERQIKGAITPGKTRSLNDVSAPIFTPRHVVEGHVEIKQLDHTPIPFHLGPKGRGKRLSDGDENLNDVSKRTKGLQDDSSSQKVIEAVDRVPVTTHQTRSGIWAGPRPIHIGGSNNLSEKAAFKTPGIPRNISFEDRTQRRHGKQPETANTSFTSNATVFSSVFDEEMSDASNESFFSTQTSVSVMDISSDRRWAPGREVPSGMEYTQYGGTVGEFGIIDGVMLSRENLVRERLQNVFPALPAFLQSAPLAVRYEITRVCSYANVSIEDLHFPITDFSKIRDYDGLWNLLRSQPALGNKDFPGKSDRDAWTASLDKFHQRFHGVTFSAKLKFSNSQEGPLFNFQLQPLRLEVSHRLGRRFGNDRFLEMSIPSLCGNKLPKLLKDAAQSEHGDACRKLIVEWMTRDKHNFMGISWGAFYVKDNTRKRPKLKLSVDEEVDNQASYTVYFFATDGVGFQADGTIPPKGEPAHRHTKMTVAAMVNWLIPLEQNKQQKCLKLFSRIALGLSKTWKTVELEPSELRYAPDLLSDDTTEVMNDGCGRLSVKMAINIVNCLGLSHVPSGFQARIGGAKGFWVVDFNEDSGRQWIEIYPSQMKWDRFLEVTDLTNHEVDHRTFEVVSWVKPLKSAALNLQLITLLEDRGKSRNSMRDAISRLLVNGLTHEIQLQRAAMDSPQTFRKWVRDNNSGIEERIKHGEVPYVAGLPRSLEEELNLLLDAGFNPQSLQFLKELAWKAYTQKCDVLKKRLNITVGRSTYAFMAVDFMGILQPDEVHLGFSTNFTDAVSGFTDTLLDGIDILVARSPAHYVSDIQRVKAVWKRELKSLKDVIVFSSKGNYPLAKKLSGGDYDGDIAWICFEPSIVDEFVNADMPECPDLVELGYIQKDKINYSNIAFKHEDPVPVFIQYSFEFNLHDNLLGICTNHKEALCYTNNDVSNYEAVFLSTLLSELVDQRKQGYAFSLQSWDRMKIEVIKTKVREPNYKCDKFDGRRRPEHIIDYLKFIVAVGTVEDILEKFHKSLTVAAYWDEDLAKLAHWARQRAKESLDWKSLLNVLEQDIKAVQQAWTKHFNHQRNPESIANFTSIVTDLHETWQAISPPADNPLSQALAPSCLPNLELSTWALLKASLGFSFGHRKYVSKFIWWMAGKQLAALKTMCGGSGGAAVVTPQMYAMLRPDSTFVKLMQSQDHDPRFWEAKAESVVPDEENIGGEWDEEMGG